MDITSVGRPEDYQIAPVPPPPAEKEPEKPAEAESEPAAAPEPVEGSRLDLFA